MRIVNQLYFVVFDDSVSGIDAEVLTCSYFPNKLTYICIETLKSKQT